MISLHEKIQEQGDKIDLKLSKIFAALHEMRTSYMKLDENFKKYTESNNAQLKSHENRIVRLEDKTFGSSFVSEAKVEYKKRKKNK